jgi:hypothetical protein
VTALLHSAMLARAEAVELDQPVDISFHEGVALGASCARGLGSAWEANALQVIADAKATAPRAGSPIGALEHCHSLDLAVRCAVAHGAGVLLGWSQATEGRDDQLPCGACGAAIVTDVEAHRVCAQGHGVFCDDECRRDFCRSPLCDDPWGVR